MLVLDIVVWQILLDAWFEETIDIIIKNRTKLDIPEKGMVDPNKSYPIIQ